MSAVEPVCRDLAGACDGEGGADLDRVGVGVRGDGGDDGAEQRLPLTLDRGLGRGERPGVQGRPAQCDRGCVDRGSGQRRSEEHTSELQSLMRISYAVFCWTNTTPYYCYHIYFSTCINLDLCSCCSTVASYT